MRVFEERFNVEHLSHSMNPEFLIRDGLMLLSVDADEKCPETPTSRRSPSNPEGDALSIEGKARSGCEGYFGPCSESWGLCL
ncbi:unnamed protein product [Lepeophtheirus salmonis]|uniref:(salmon louse) hypothetical protein n=1 Tax=Lepeophtheirus salmonis TaxID=72036 RepID=A0A7R8CXR5_LEPSM|nr:unnamed protein product [Lepeophtheirus salmonis]CAF2964801.1 unnamed protein product [Lepeophtheirus salmonis]